MSTMHALIIEDDWLIAMHLEELLREQGFDSCAVVDTEEAAVAAAQERCPDVITADVRLRRGTGVAAVRAICARQSVPVVYVTGNPQELADDPRAVVVAKPFTGPMLQQAVHAVCPSSGLAAVPA